MSTRDGLRHVVVDGSNIATEGRSMPSLHQLQEAVMSFMEEHPDTAVTVVVDATFGHRIDKKEAKEFEEGIANNELVAPPAGAVGRGDAFVLGIADKSGASILSNDSFQEFHAEYEWLFDEGRLIGGKPVPHVGWVWVDRLPVRGPVSRKATGGRAGRGGRSRSKGESSVRTGSKEASGPMPVPTSPPPSAKQAAASSSGTSASTSSSTPSSAKKSASRRRGSQRGNADETTSESDVATSGSDAASRDAGRSAERRGQRSTPTGQDPVNELMPFLDFVEKHQPGAAVQAVVESYSSHGAYVALGGDVRGYVPLRLMAEPAPRSAKQVMKVDDTVDLVVVSFAPMRRSIDLAVPELAEAAIAAAQEEDLDEAGATKKTAAKKTAVKKTAAKKTAVKKTAVKKTAVKKTAAKKTAVKKTAAKKTAVKKTTAKKAAVKKTATTTPAKTTRPAKKTAAKKTAAKKTAAKKTAAKKTAAKKTDAEQSVAKQTAATTTANTKTPARKTADKKTAAATSATTRRSTRRTPKRPTKEN
ncbi:MAG: histone H1-like repetitive region-containing protein [Ilumatobacter sp.]|uniref:histone H1-like repetitive region-containing protein n=1 Tax=Ilumatobacter sp. TaxID=1967498 RepID=UPI00391A94BE